MATKHYVFFARTIKRVGGAQLYMKAKAQYLTENGWTVHVVYCQEGESYIAQLQGFHCLYIADLYKPAFLYFPFKRDKIIRKIISFFYGIDGEIVIESHSDALSTWAEIIASLKHNIRHISYNLEEIIQVREEMIPFYKFKYSRHELFGILNSIEVLFEKTGCNLDYGNPELLAYGAADCIDDVDIPATLRKLDGYVIGVVGRLDKDYIFEYAKCLKIFCDEHKETNFSVVFVGGAPSGCNIWDSIRDLLDNCGNIQLFNTGYIFPIPRGLVNKFDVCLAGAGAAYAISDEGVKTLAMDPRDFLVNGIMRVTTDNAVFSDNDKQTANYWMNQVYYNPEKYELARKHNQYDFSSHIKVLDRCTPQFDYDLSFLDVNSISLFCKRVVCSLFPIFIRELLASMKRIKN